VPREPIERGMTPKENLRPVGHVLMAEWPWRDGFEDGGVAFASQLVLDLHRHAVAVPLQRVGARFVTQYRKTEHTNGPTEALFEVLLDLSCVEQHTSVRRSLRLLDHAVTGSIGRGA